MREGYGSRFVNECVCVSVTTLAISLYVQLKNTVPLLWRFLHVDFVENALFRSYGRIC